MSLLDHQCHWTPNWHEINQCENGFSHFISFHFERIVLQYLTDHLFIYCTNSCSHAGETNTVVVTSYFMGMQQNICRVLPEHGARCMTSHSAAFVVGLYIPVTCTMHPSKSCDIPGYIHTSIHPSIHTYIHTYNPNIHRYCNTT